jgi:putative SOS response-associated peptidase YedK
MCNLYNVRATAAEVANYFKANDAFRGELEKDCVAPGKPGYVVRDDGGERVAETMKWGFCTRKERKRPAREGEMPFLYDWDQRQEPLQQHLEAVADEARAPVPSSIHALRRA